MAKINGLFGSMSGKLADVVMVVRNGQQISRKYQPYVSNPQTAAQIANRAKLKLISQLGEVVAPMIAFRRSGMVSPRNKFTSVNIKKSTYADNAASVDLESIDLTGGTLYANVSATRDGNNLTATVSHDIDASRIVYGLFAEEGETLREIEKGVVNASGSRYTTIEMTGLRPYRHVLYAYIIRDNSDAARVAFGNLSVPRDNVTAFVNVVRYLTDADVSLSMTAAVEVSPAS